MGGSQTSGIRLYPGLIDFFGDGSAGGCAIAAHRLPASVVGDWQKRLWRETVLCPPRICCRQKAERLYPGRWP